MKTVLAPNAKWYEVAKVKQKEKIVVKKPRTKPPQIDKNFGKWLRKEVFKAKEVVKAIQIEKDKGQPIVFPPKKKIIWKGFTNQEIDMICIGFGVDREIVEIIESKLKGKNT